MKDLFTILIGSAPAIMLVLFAGLMAYHDKPGWGWFLFVALLIAGSTRIKVD